MGITGDRMTTLGDQLKLGSSYNFMSGDKLFLVRCFHCSSAGKENYAPAVASGTCAWCGWKETTNEEPKNDN